MKRDDLYDLAAFAVVAEKASFTRAAAELGMSQSALSHAIKSLEERMGVRLLSRTTRSVSVTDAGEKLLRSLSPALGEISHAVDAVGAMRYGHYAIVPEPNDVPVYETIFNEVYRRFYPSVAPLSQTISDLQATTAVGRNDA